MDIERIIGDYQSFFSDLLHRLTTAGISVKGLAPIQFLYRTATIPEYENVRNTLKTLCKEFVETAFNGRPISIMILKSPLVLEGGFQIEMLELAAPRPAHMYPSGLESVGFYVGKTLPTFITKYKKQLTGVKKHGKYCNPAFITFDNGKTVKFYDYTLEEIVLLQGWLFEHLTESADSSMNRLAETVNTWLYYVHGVKDWQKLLEGVVPKQTNCGPVYELENPLDRPSESFAIADMRGNKVAEPHYHTQGETEIYFVLQGKGTVVVGGKEIQVGKGSVVVTLPDTTHFTIPKGDLVLAVVNTPPFNSENSVDLAQSNKAVGFNKGQYERLLKDIRGYINEE